MATKRRRTRIPAARTLRIHAKRLQQIRVLEYIRRMVCSYPGFPCDCKCVKEGSPSMRSPGEFSGCYELEQAIQLIIAMTDVEYQKFMNRDERFEIPRQERLS